LNGDVLLCLRLPEEGRVDLRVTTPFFRDFVVWEDRVYRAFRLAETTANASVRVDEQLVVFLSILLNDAAMNCIHRANRNAGLIFTADAGFRDDKCHNVVFLLRLVMTQQYLPG
jgi:hypothetical protein